MGVSVEPFKTEDAFTLLEDPRLAHVRAYMTEERMAHLETNNLSFSLKRDGKLLCIAGIAPLWPNVGEGWAIFAKDVKENFLEIHKIVKKFIKESDFNRVQMTVKFGFYEGHRWARLLGFELECPRMKHYLPTGEDVSMYVVIK